MQEAVRQVAQPVGGIVLLYAAALAGVHADADWIASRRLATYVEVGRKLIRTDPYARGAVGFIILLLWPNSCKHVTCMSKIFRELTTLFFLTVPRMNYSVEVLLA
jgi:hypothetical protein